MARLETQAALGELVHVFQQLDGALEHAREVEQRVRFQRVLVLLHRDREDAPHAARHDGVEIAPEGADRLVDRGRELGRAGAMSLPGIGRIAGVRVEAGPHELLAARLAVAGQEVRAQPIEQRAKRGLGLAIRRAKALRHTSNRPGALRHTSNRAGALRHFARDRISGAAL